LGFFVPGGTAAAPSDDAVVGLVATIGPHNLSFQLHGWSRIAVLGAQFAIGPERGLRLAVELVFRAGRTSCHKDGPFWGWSETPSRYPLCSRRSRRGVLHWLCSCQFSRHRSILTNVCSA